MEKENLEEIIESIHYVQGNEEKNKNYHYKTITLSSYEYTTKTNNEKKWYTFVPSNIKIKRVPQAVLGKGVLGRSFPGLKIVEIREDLYGKEWEEVLRHEMNHINFPYLTENQIRTKTKQELPFQSRYH